MIHNYIYNCIYNIEILDMRIIENLSEKDYHLPLQSSNPKCPNFPGVRHTSLLRQPGCKDCLIVNVCQCYVMFVKKTWKAQFGKKTHSVKRLFGSS